MVGHLASLLMQLNIGVAAGASARRVVAGLLRIRSNAFFLPDAETEAAMTPIEQQWQAIIAEV
ncbi:hypothetical protein ACNKHU_17130 [Shigella flexneri]